MHDAPRAPDDLVVLHRPLSILATAIVLLVAAGAAVVADRAPWEPITQVSVKYTRDATRAAVDAVRRCAERRHGRFYSSVVSRPPVDKLHFEQEPNDRDITRAMSCMMRVPAVSAVASQLIPDEPPRWLSNDLVVVTNLDAPNWPYVPRPEGSGRLHFHVHDQAWVPVVRAIVAFPDERPQRTPCAWGARSPGVHPDVMTREDGTIQLDVCPGRFTYRVYREDIGEVRGEVEAAAGIVTGIHLVLAG